MASHVPDPGRFTLALYDLRFDAPGSIAPADLFVFSGINQDLPTLIETLAFLRGRYPQALFILGGPVAWSLDEAGDLDRLSAFDHVFIGDGEETFPAFLESWARGGRPGRTVRAASRFPIREARGFHRPFVEATFRRYYGAVIEVSRGCPFLCEFCDIRILPDNNRAHNKPVALILSELDYLARLGVRQVQFACDNFIGDPVWAMAVVDAMLDWQARTGLRVAVYTWLTINLHANRPLLEKMRRAGFEMLFIGIETFHRNSLLETAKIQNTASDMVQAIRTIQSYGFIVVAGLIFGFDSDDEGVFDLSLEAMGASGLISGDPSLLTALPGTPLYRRLKLAGRIRDVRYGLGGFKLQTNIHYLMPRKALVQGYLRFVRRNNDPALQLRRYRAFLDGLDGGRYLPQAAGGFGNLARYLRMLAREPATMRQFVQRFLHILGSPAVARHVAGALALTLQRGRRHRGLLAYFQFWLFAWTNNLVKYAGLRPDDFDVDSVPEGFDLRGVLPATYEEAREPIPEDKIRVQRRQTAKQLRRLIETRQSRG